MLSARLDEYQHAVLRYDNLFLFCRNGRVLVLAQGFLDLLLDFEQGNIQCRGLHFNFWKIGNMGSAAICRECTKHRIRLVLNGDAMRSARSSLVRPLSLRACSIAIRQHRIIPALRLRHRSGGSPRQEPPQAAVALRSASLRLGVRHGICVAKMLDNTQSIICAFGLAAAAPRSPYRHLEL